MDRRNENKKHYCKIGGNRSKWRKNNNSVELGQTSPRYLESVSPRTYKTNQTLQDTNDNDGDKAELETRLHYYMVSLS